MKCPGPKWWPRPEKIGLGTYWETASESQKGSGSEITGKFHNKHDFFLSGLQRQFGGD
jgi:hypothetical protein